MPIEVELPDGSVAEFPDGMPSDAIKGAISKKFPAQNAAQARPDTGMQNMDASQVYVDEMGFGLPGKASAGLNALVQRGISAVSDQPQWAGKSVGELYDQNRSQYQAARQQYAEKNPVANAAASIGGAVQGGAAATAVGGTVLSQIAPRLAAAVQSSYAGKMATDAVSGAAQGAASAYGHDQDIAPGAIVGGLVGGLARPVIDAGGSALRAVGGLVGVGNQSRANSAIAEAVARSGRSVDDVANDLAAATADGQSQYRVVDALGNSGQRMLSGIVRSPGDERQAIVEALQSRQAGQGRRIQSALEEGFGSPQTAQQTEAATQALRSTNADLNYEAARQAAGAVDPTSAIAAADNFLTPGAQQVMSPLNNIADDSVEAAVRRARGYLTDGNSVISDFNTALRSKQELDAMIEGAKPTIQRQLIPIRNALDDSLAKASQPYANARDTFRRQSQDLEAVDVGRQASIRGRVEDTIPQFQKMTPSQQENYRAGYVDPLIADVQKASGPMTNKARPLINDATAAEFPAFAIPGREQQLMDRISREQRMFETANSALGGSKTADNLSDIADAQTFDPSMIGAFLSGGVMGAAKQGLTKAVGAVNGRNQETRNIIARALMESGPTQAKAALADAVASGKKLTAAQEAVVQALISSTATAPGRLQAN